jgi:hypothetical protein
LAISASNGTLNFATTTEPSDMANQLRATSTKAPTKTPLAALHSGTQSRKRQSLFPGRLTSGAGRTCC